MHNILSDDIPRVVLTYPYEGALYWLFQESAGLPDWGDQPGYYQRLFGHSGATTSPVRQRWFLCLRKSYSRPRT